MPTPETESPLLSAADGPQNSKSQEQCFKHSPLPNASAYIRLLSIPTAEGSPSRYTLSTWLFTEAPSYHAISYTWGSADQDENIVLNGATKTLRRNCADVLRQLRHFRTANYYFIDMLCIDQDDLDEKSQQVAMMSSIYQRAAHVLVCIGTSEGVDESSIRLLCEYGEYWALDGNLENPGGDRQKLLRSEYRRFLSWLKYHPGRDILSLWLLALSIAQREYFKRVWIIPEFLLAQSASLLLGDFCIRWQALHDVLRFLNFRHGMFYACCVRSFVGDDATEFAMQIDTSDADRVLVEREVGPDSGRIAAQLLNEKGVLAWGEGEGTFSPKWSVGEILRLTQHKLCQDRRDKIYSMLSLLDQDGKQLIAPDYTMTPFALASAVVEQHDLFAEEVAMLVTVLQLHPQTLEVQHGLARKAQPDSTLMTIHPPWRPPAEPLHRLGAFQKMRLGSDSDWQLGPLVAGESLRLVIAPSTGEEIGRACADAKDGDWILKTSFNRSSWLCLHNPVVRPVDDNIFAIVGFAEIPQAWYALPPAKEDEHFEVCFSSEDFLMYLASINYDPEVVGTDIEQPPLSKRLNVDVCEAPLSSYAVRRSPLPPV